MVWFEDRDVRTWQKATLLAGTGDVRVSIRPGTGQARAVIFDSVTPNELWIVRLS